MRMNIPEKTKKESIINEINVKEAKKLLDEKKAYLLDVREKEEFEFVNIKPDKCVTLMNVQKIVNELPKEKPILVICRTGNRSLAAASYLKSLGFDASNIKGGLFAWHDEIDDSIPKYIYWFDGQKTLVKKINE